MDVLQPVFWKVVRKPLEMLSQFSLYVFLGVDAPHFKDASIYIYIERERGQTRRGREENACILLAN